jgi:lantibiotic leader peptide-processing serine protease
MTRIRSVAILGVLAIAACSDLPVTPTAPLTATHGMSSVKGGKSYVLIANTEESLPDDLSAAVSAAGGTLTSAMGDIGVAAATSSDPNFASKLSGYTVVEDVMMKFGNPRVADVIVEDLSAPTFTESAIGAVETFRAVQWAPDAVHAPEAWEADPVHNQGAGARVAILDGGIRDTHIDIAPNLDVAHSVSFVPGQPFNFDAAVDAKGVCGGAPDTFWHGTHVAGIVAGPANNVGTVGIAPKATIIGVKVLHCGSGSFNWVISGIYYAATPIARGGAGANIINMSLGAVIERGAPGVAQLLRALNRATKYANKRGVTVIAAAGNDALDLDHSGRLAFVPAESEGVLAISATGPIGWALGSTDLDRPASYTNFGKTAIDFAAPGGDYVLPGNAVCSKPRFPSGSVVQFCWVMDMVMAPCRGGGTSNGSYCWAAGTSMASPAAAGVAALIVGKYGPMRPSELEEILRESADDLGKRGKDAFYGKGRVNAFRAVQSQIGDENHQH